jgi:hypothetical protein
MILSIPGDLEENWRRLGKAEDACDKIIKDLQALSRRDTTMLRNIRVFGDSSGIIAIAVSIN